MERFQIGVVASVAVLSFFLGRLTAPTSATYLQERRMAEEVSIGAEALKWRNQMARLRSFRLKVAS